MDRSPTSLSVSARGAQPMPRVWRAWDPLWARRNALGGELLTLAGLVVLLVVNGFGYPTVARIAAWRGVTVWDPTTPLDLWIPALPWTVAIYSTMYLYLPFGVLSAPRSDAANARSNAFVAP